MCFEAASVILACPGYHAIANSRCRLALSQPGAEAWLLSQLRSGSERGAGDLHKHDIPSPVGLVREPGQLAVRNVHSREPGFVHANTIPRSRRDEHIAPIHLSHLHRPP